MYNLDNICRCIKSDRPKNYECFPQLQSILIALWKQLGTYQSTKCLNLYGRLAKYGCITMYFKRLDMVQQFEYNYPTAHFRFWNWNLNINYWKLRFLDKQMILYNIHVCKTAQYIAIKFKRSDSSWIQCLCSKRPPTHPPTHPTDLLYNVSKFSKQWNCRTPQRYYQMANLQDNHCSSSIRWWLWSTVLN